MGEIAEMMLDGTMCQVCGEFMGESIGYPVTCVACQPEGEEVLDAICVNIIQLKTIKCITFPKCKRMFGSIKDMEQHWKALYPCIAHREGKVFVTSTINRKSDWFYKTYKEALHGINAFHVNLVHYLETPRYQDEEFAATVQNNVGPKAWRQEMLCEAREHGDFYR